MKAKIIKCWVTRHHWLLTDEVQHDVDDPQLFRYHYTCQVCGKEKVQFVINLDITLPKTEKEPK